MSSFFKKKRGQFFKIFGKKKAFGIRKSIFSKSDPFFLCAKTKKKRQNSKNGPFFGQKTAFFSFFWPFFKKKKSSKERLRQNDRKKTRKKKKTKKVIFFSTRKKGRKKRFDMCFIREIFFLKVKKKNPWITTALQRKSRGACIWTIVNSDPLFGPFFKFGSTFPSKGPKTIVFP